MKKFRAVLFTFLIVLSYLIISIGSSTPKPISYPIREDLSTKESESINVNYNIPNVTLLEGEQIQTKGKVTVSIEIEPFQTIKEYIVNEKLTATDKPAYDRYESSNTPKYTITPDHIVYTIRIKNNLSRILKLREALIVFTVDGVNYNIPDATKTIDPFLASFITPGSEQIFKITGQSTNSLPKNATIGFSLYDIPIEMSDAGEIKKRENFEWFFKYELISKSSPDFVKYSYNTKPVEFESCSVCKAVGTISTIKNCTTCGGDGENTNSEGKKYKCFTCGGSGKLTDTKDCSNPSCSSGKIYHRKSPDLKVTENWTGYELKITTIPAGASLSMISPFNADKLNYYNFASTPATINWLNKPGVVNPIKIELNGQVIKVLPYTLEGKITNQIVIDFSDPNNPIAKKGKIVK